MARDVQTKHFAVDHINVLTELLFFVLGRFLDLTQVCDRGGVMSVMEVVCEWVDVGLTAYACVIQIWVRCVCTSVWRLNGYICGVVDMRMETCAQVYFLIHRLKFFRELLGQLVIF